MGLTNVVAMVPFCRTPEEGDKVLAVMAENGLKRGKNGLEIYVMAEIPSNIILADQFADRFDGFSIGSNDLTQLILGVDRDSAELAFSTSGIPLQRQIARLIATAHEKGRRWDSAPALATTPFAALEKGIDSISVNPDSVNGHDQVAD
jgi:pyruvate,water dikinase